MTTPQKAKGSKQKGQNTDRSCHLTGLIGEARFIEFASTRGWELYRGFDGHCRCDYVVDDQGVMTGGLFRVEVKRVESEQSTKGNYYYTTVTKLRTSRFDFLFVSTLAGDYLIPSSDCPKNTVSIKVVGGEYKRNITAPVKYEVYRVA